MHQQTRALDNSSTAKGQYEDVNPHQAYHRTLLSERRNDEELYNICCSEEPFVLLFFWQGVCKVKGLAVACEMLAFLHAFDVQSLKLLVRHSSNTAIHE